MPISWWKRWDCSSLASQWENLLRAVRPGSRTVLYRPESVEQVVDLARRGFRLLVVHHDEEFTGEVRRQLRSQGLISNVMGSCHIQESGAGLSLAKRFYDLLIAVQPITEDLQEAVDSLGPDATLICAQELKVERLEAKGDFAIEGLRAYRKL